MADTEFLYVELDERPYRDLAFTFLYASSMFLCLLVGFNELFHKDFDLEYAKSIAYSLSKIKGLGFWYRKIVDFFYIIFNRNIHLGLFLDKDIKSNLYWF